MEKLGLKVGYSKTVNIGNYENEKFEFYCRIPTAEADRDSYTGIMLDELNKLKALANGKVADLRKHSIQQDKVDRTTAKEGRESGSATKSAKTEDISPEDGPSGVESVSGKEYREALCKEALELGIKNPKKLGTPALQKRIDKAKAKSAEVVQEPIDQPKTAAEVAAPKLEDVRTTLGGYVKAGKLEAAGAKKLIADVGKAAKLADVKPELLQAVLDAAKSMTEQEELDI